MYNRVETRPGLDAFAAAPAAGLTGALGPLLAWARAVVPAGQQSSTPLYFMATGGLRRLPVQQQEALLAEVRKQLGQSGFRWARFPELCRAYAVFLLGIGHYSMHPKASIQALAHQCSSVAS